MLGHGDSDGGAQAVALDNDPMGGDAEGAERVVDQRDAVGDEASFGGGTGGEAEAPVVDR